MKILIPDTVFADDHALEREAAGDFELEIRRAVATADLDLKALASADAIVGQHRVVYDAPVAAAASRCRILVRAGTGVDNVELAAWSARGIPVCNVPDYGISEIADHTIGLTLALARGLHVYQRRVETAPTAPWVPFPLPPTVRRLSGAVLLVVGLGAIGRAVAGRAQAHEMRVCYVDPQVADAPAGLTRVAELDRALPQADIVSLHVPLNAATRHLIDARRIGLMKPGALIINCARGGVLEGKALYDGLRSGQVGGAGLDVWESEPPAADDPLFRALAADEDWLHGRLIATPHVGSISAASIRDMRVKAIATARDFLLTGTLRHCVNRDALQRPS
ncbi:MAG: C-terminal binding protein [Alphaproteobacteria bacterium]|nr:C-terminal binding protein [Alphaproteobacteria bacterium]